MDNDNGTKQGLRKYRTLPPKPPDKNKKPAKRPPVPPRTSPRTPNLNESNEQIKTKIATVDDSDEETVSVEKYNELLQKFESLTQKHSQQTMYVSALEEMIDVERRKVADLSRKDKKLLVRSKSYFSIAKDMARDQTKEKLSARKKHHQKQQERKELTRKRQLEARMIYLDDKEKFKRMNVLQEILNTEKDYLEVLEVLLKTRGVLQQEQVISEAENNILFSNVNEILQLHQEIVKSLSSRFLSIEDKECYNISIGDIFYKLAENLPIYATYINNQQSQSEMVDICSQKKSFCNVLYRDVDYFLEKAFVINQLRSFLITPVQRICKYPLLIRELIQVTDNAHEDSKNLKFALEKIQESTMAVNEEKKNFEQHYKMQQIQDSLDGTKGFILNIDSRYLIKEGDVWKTSKGKTQERHLFLFNDILIYGSKSLLKTGRIQMKGKISLNQLLVNDLADSELYKNAFELIRLDQKKKYIIASKLSDYQGSSEKSTWVTAIADQICSCITASETMDDDDNPWEKTKTPELITKFSNIVRK